MSKFKRVDSTTDSVIIIKDKTEDKSELAQLAGEKVWESIKDVSLSIFSLPPQKVSTLFTKVAVVDDAILLKLNSNATAAIASLESTLNSSVSPQGDSKRVERFDVKVTENGLVAVSAKSATK